MLILTYSIGLFKNKNKKQKFYKIFTLGLSSLCITKHTPKDCVYLFIWKSPKFTPTKITHHMVQFFNNTDHVISIKSINTTMIYDLQVSTITFHYDLTKLPMQKSFNIILQIHTLISLYMAHSKLCFIKHLIIIIQ